MVRTPAGTRRAGWVLLAIICGVMGAVSVVIGTYRLIGGSVGDAALFGANVLLFYWLTVGSLRRARRSAQS